ncbi:hypothetical protein [Guptibacillus hwajinpoensis]|uniref:Uncharacterized protein n=1 Tax=Guptibacillus hwajinpoensis TaxID=208199 RepID=A0A0J6FX25_9BACL|nr:hypothetical protein [Alkalihalobacillus macyae]KMM38922.1 hypothetical protein AB986_06630 [Alkalihalobacillus macyae]MDP4550761.1 hypothetical protein [Alkalihalobacillus macyae]
MTKKQTLLLSSIAAAGTIGISSYLLKDEQKRDKVKTKANDFRKQVTRKFSEGLPIQKAGNPTTPDQSEDSGDSKMVYEGSQFPTQYYNKLENMKSVEKSHEEQLKN